MKNGSNSKMKSKITMVLNGNSRTYLIQSIFWNNDHNWRTHKNHPLWKTNGTLSFHSTTPSPPKWSINWAHLWKHIEDLPPQLGCKWYNRGHGHILPMVPRMWTQMWRIDTPFPERYSEHQEIHCYEQWPAKYNQNAEAWGGFRKVLPTHKAPYKIPPHKIQQLFSETVLHPPGEEPLNELVDISSLKIPIDTIIIANHRVPNLWDMFSYWNISTRPGAPVSSFLWRKSGDLFLK